MKRYQNLVLILLISLVACGKDSANPTAPNGLSTSDALQSLKRGLASLGQTSGSPTSPLTVAMLQPVAASGAPLVGQITTTVDGTPITMFGMALRIVYPPNTCLEQLLGITNFGNPSVCTTPPGGVMLILWQTSAASQAPDKVVIVYADTGVSSFTNQPFADTSSTIAGALPAGALYLDHSDALWSSSGGEVTSAVTSAGQSCSMALPIFAMSATCNFGTFTESGTVTFSLLDLGSVTATGTHTVAFSGQVFNGMILTVTATAPIRFPPTS